MQLWTRLPCGVLRTGLPCAAGLLVAGLLCSACDERRQEPSEAENEPEPTPRPSPEEERCSEGIYGVEAYDQLVTFRFGQRPLLFAEADVLLADAAGVEAALERALAVDPSELPPAARVALQNDVWGLWQRVEPGNASTYRHEVLRHVASRLVRRLALPPDEIPTGELAMGSAAREVLRAEDDWREVGTEMPVLSHESAFDLRRLFHHVRRDAQVAMTSQLVALDDTGVPHPTDITGDLEILVAGADGLRARLFELDRRALRCRGPRDALVEVRTVGHVPGLGANRFFLDLEPPRPIATFPCARCHDDDFQMALTNEDIAIEPRLRSVLELVARDATPLFRGMDAP